MHGVAAVSHMSNRSIHRNEFTLAELLVATNRNGQDGFSLVEVLVTIVVFSIGMLGITGLNTLSKRAGYESVQRSTASELAYSLIEEIRANNAAVATYLAAGTLGGGTLGAEPAPRCDDPVNACTAVQFATHSLWEFEQILDSGMETVNGGGTGGLVSPSACIAGPAGGGAGDYTITIVWRGVTGLSDPGLNACGAASGLYGANNEFRRMVVVQSYIDPSI